MVFAPKSSECHALFFCDMHLFYIPIQAMGLVIGLRFQSTQTSAFWLGIFISLFCDMIRIYIIIHLKQAWVLF